MLKKHQWGVFLHHSRGEMDGWCRVLGKNRDTRSDVVDKLIFISLTSTFTFFKPSFFSCFEENSSCFFWLAGETKPQSRQGALAKTQIPPQELQAPNLSSCLTRSAPHRDWQILAAGQIFPGAAVIFTVYFVAKIILSCVKCLCVDFSQNWTVCHQPGGAVW